jgi:integrase/recombinase XerD
MNTNVLTYRLDTMALIGDQLPTYRSHLVQFERYLRDNSLGFNREGIESFVAWARQTYRNPNTFNIKVAAVKALTKHLFRASPDYFDFAKRSGMEDFLSGIRAVKIQASAVGQEKVMSEAEIRRLLERLKPRWRLVVQFLYSTGLRVSEALGIRIADLEAFESYYSVTVVGKGNKARVVKVAKSLIDSILQELGGTTYLFETRSYRNGSPGGKPLRREYVSRELGHLTWLYLGQRHGAHHFRHSFASHVIAKTGNVKGVSHYLGHADAGFTLRVYVHNELSLADLGITDSTGEAGKSR